MTSTAYRRLINAPPADRHDLFLTAARRLGAPDESVEKDFWVCWTLNELYHERPVGGPRMLFKGGTSLSKAYGLIERFSEDIDITVFRDDLDEGASVGDLEALSNKKRRMVLDAIRDACREYITGPLNEFLSGRLADATKGAGRVEVDQADPDQQTLLVQYPTVVPRDGTYVRHAVRLEFGAKSALDPNRPAAVRPYVGHEIEDPGLTVADVTTIEATRTFWDKVVIAHSLRHWYERRGVLRQGGQRVSRHYYDLHCLLGSGPGMDALADPGLGADCVRHARMFFDRHGYGLASAVPGSFALAPVGGMVEALSRDYAGTASMIFGPAPGFGEILSSVSQIERIINGGT